MLKLLIRYVFCFVLCVPSVKVSKLFLLTSLTLCARLCFLPNHNFYAKVLSLTITTGDCTFYAVFLEFMFFISKLLGSEEGKMVLFSIFRKSVQNFFICEHIINWGPVTKTENIKIESTKILRPTHFSGPKDIKTDKFFSVLFPG